MPTLAALREEIRANYLPDEDAALQRLVGAASLGEAERETISSPLKGATVTCMGSCE